MFQTRLLFALAACLLLSNCNLINTALRLAPLLMLVEKSEAGTKSPLSEVQMRGKQVQERGNLQPSSRDVNLASRVVVAR